MPSLRGDRSPDILLLTIGVICCDLLWAWVVPRIPRIGSGVRWLGAMPIRGRRRRCVEGELLTWVTFAPGRHIEMKTTEVDESNDSIVVFSLAN